MPASQRVDIHRNGEIQVEVTPVNHEASLFFTDERPEFDLKVYNNRDSKIGDGSKLQWGIGVGEGRPEAYFQSRLEIEVPPNESRTYRVGGELLALEGHGVFAVDSSGLGNPNGEVSKLKARSLDTNYSVPYSFSVWDRENYQTLHERPVTYQRYALAFSVVVAILALVQIGLNLI